MHKAPSIVEAVIWHRQKAREIIMLNSIQINEEPEDPDEWAVPDVIYSPNIPGVKCDPFMLKKASVYHKQAFCCRRGNVGLIHVGNTPLC